MQRLLIHINKFFCVLTSYFLYKLKTFSVSLLKATKYGPIHLLWSYRCALKTVYGIPFAQYVWLLNWNQSLWKWCVAYKQHFLKLYVDCCWNILKCNAVKSCNIYAVQQDTWSVLMSEFYSARMLARHVSDLIGPPSGAFCTSCICRFGTW